MSDAVRGVWVQLEDGRLVPKSQYVRSLARQKEAGALRSNLPSPTVIRDISPFINVAIDGAEISSRSTKREMMKRHGLIEMGDAKRITRRKSTTSLTETKKQLKETLQQLGVVG